MGLAVLGTLDIDVDADGDGDGDDAHDAHDAHDADADADSDYGDDADGDNADDADDADADDADDADFADDDDTKQVNGGVVEVARAETDSQAKTPNHTLSWLWLDFVIRLYDSRD